MHTRIVSNNTPSRQAAQAAVALYRAGLTQQAAQVWRAAMQAWSAQK